jgi:uncharacterized protein YybS (DUF2232 family)
MSTSALADGGKAVALSVILGIILAFVPLLSIAAVPALPVPVAYITSRHGAVTGLLASLAAGLLVAAFGGLFAGLLVFLLAAAVGGGAGLALRRGAAMMRLLVLVAALFLVTLLVWSTALLVSAGMGPAAAFDRMADQAVGPASELYAGLGMDQQSIDEAVSGFRSFISVLPYLLPALLLVFSIVLSGATVALARQVFSRLRQPFPAGLGFSEFRLHFAFAYLMIIGLATQLMAPYLQAPFADYAGFGGMNLMIVSQALFFIQGLAIAHYFLGRHKVPQAARIMVYAAMVLVQMLFSLVSWVGLFDTWIDYRRRFNRKRPDNQQKEQ